MVACPWQRQVQHPHRVCQSKRKPQPAHVCALPSPPPPPHPLLSLTCVAAVVVETPIQWYQRLLCQSKGNAHVLVPGQLLCVMDVEFMAQHPESHMWQPVNYKLATKATKKRHPAYLCVLTDIAAICVAHVDAAAAATFGACIGTIHLCCLSGM